MTQKRRGLGRGLGALIPSSTTAAPGGARPTDVFFTSSTSSDTKSADDEGANAGGTAKKQEVAQADNDSAVDDRALKAPDEATDEPAQTALAEADADADLTDETQLVPVPGASFAELPIDSIRANTQQPRTVFDEDDLAELTQSIAEVGVLQPIVVRPDADKAGQYELIMGERRWRASRAAGKTSIPAIIRETAQSDLLRDALLENLHRADLNPLEEAAAYRQLLDDFGCTQEELSARIARSRPQISNTLRLLKLPPLVQRRVAAGVLSAGHARALLRLEDPAAMERLAQRIVAEGLSVRATEEIAALGGVPPEPARKQPRAGTRIEAIDNLATRLSDRFDTRVKIALGKRKGRLTVEFATVDDLNRIVDVIAPGEEGLFKK